MAATFTISARESLGSKRANLISMAADNSYPIGGYSVSPATVGLFKIDAVIPVNSGQSGYDFNFVTSTSKILIRNAAGGGTFTATGTTTLTEVGSDMKGSANTDLTGAGGAAPTNSALISALAAADNTTAFTIANQPDQGRNIGIGFNNNTGGPASGNATNVAIVGTFNGVVQNETITFSGADLTNVTNGNYVYKYGSKPFDSIASITPSAAQPANFRHVAGPGSKVAMYNALKGAAISSVVKLTKNAADLAPAGIVDVANQTVNFGALTDGDDIIIKYVVPSGSSGTVGSGTEGEVANGTNLTALTAVQMYFIGE